MAIPDYQACMLPLLQFARDGRECQLKDAVRVLGSEFKLTDDEKNQFLPSGQQPVFINRIGWARTYLKKAGLLRSPRRGYFTITERGLSVLKENIKAIDVKYLGRFSEFAQFKAIRRSKTEVESSVEINPELNQTPHEALESAYERLHSELAAEILQSLKTTDPTLFENLVIELLVKMGYGGSRQDAGLAIGRSGDAGIDGIIKEDQLGLDNIYVQAKRWQNKVGRPEIHGFAGALQGQRARKGIFMTTSEFTREAQDYVSQIDLKIILLDGKSIAKLMIDFGVGVTTVATYEVKKIDADYFSED